MPTYEYRCNKCGDLFEVRQKFSDETLTTHENCGGPVERLLSVPAFQFKGSGFYITDYKSGNSGSGNSAGKGEGAEKKEGSEKKEAPATAGGTSEKSAPAAPETKASSIESK